jgi:hypothetical protein
MMTESNTRDRGLRYAPTDEHLTSAIVADLRGAPRAELRHAVASYVADAKRTKTEPQDVIASLKALVQRDAQPHMRAEEYPRLVRQVVGWAIEEYYGR